MTNINLISLPDRLRVGKSLHLRGLARLTKPTIYCEENLVIGALDIVIEEIDFYKRGCCLRNSSKAVPEPSSSRCSII